MLARVFGTVASRRVRTMATVGGVLADADYASDPPAALSALNARVVLLSSRGRRELTVQGADPGPLHDLHRAKRAAGRSADPGLRRRGGVPEVQARSSRTAHVSHRRRPSAVTVSRSWWARAATVPTGSTSCVRSIRRS